MRLGSVPTARSIRCWPPMPPSAASRSRTARSSRSSSAMQRRTTTSSVARRHSSPATSRRPSAKVSRAVPSLRCHPPRSRRPWSAWQRRCSPGGPSTRRSRSRRCTIPSQPWCSAHSAQRPRTKESPMAEAALRPSPADDSLERLPTEFDLCYTWNYDTVRQELGNLYEKAKRDQWNATDQLPWSLDVDPEAENIPDIQIPVYATHIWDKLTPGEVKKVRRESLSWTLSQFMHGEQGALLATAQIVDATPWIESKFYAASQVMDEARHVEVYSRYLREKLTRTYPINRHLKTLLDQILTDSRWDMKYLGMQIMVEGLAMAAFGYMHKLCREPLLTELTHYVMRDEARHVAFGVLSLADFFTQLSPTERRDREEFLTEGCRLMRDRLLMEDVWEEMGWPVDEVKQIVLDSPQMKEFRKMLFAKIVPNVKRLGLLTPFVRERFEELDILQFENEEPSA